jgi:hypothetical protein
MPDALLLLALVLLLRAALDPWNNLYYHVPFLFALIAYEVRSGRMPLLTVCYSLLLLTFVPVKGVPHMPPDAHAAAYAVIVLPTIGWLAARLFLPAGARDRILMAGRRRISWRPRTNEVTTTRAAIQAGPR